MTSDRPSPSPLPAAGRREYVSLPDWKIGRIRAKLDTGARTSAIHVSSIEELDDEMLRFEVVIRDGDNPKTRWVKAPLARNSRVRPSTGKLQERPVVSTLMRLGSLEREIELSLVPRKGMLCRMLLGRTALADLVVVDPARKYLIAPPKTHKAADSPKKPR